MIVNIYHDNKIKKIVTLYTRYVFSHTKKKSRLDQSCSRSNITCGRKVKFLFRPFIALSKKKYMAWNITHCEQVRNAKKKKPDIL